MEQTNGYLRLAFQAGKAYVKVYPAVGEGKPLALREAENYLNQQGFTEYDALGFRKIVLEGQGVMCLGDSKVSFVTEMMTATISADKMSCVCRFFPPSVGGGLLSEKDILEGIKTSGVTAGIDTAVIEDFMRHPVYFTDVEVARGIPARQGHDAFIEYFFNTSPNRKPHHNEDGSVDYHNLSILNEVAENELLARLHPADPGEAGIDILGRGLNPSPVKFARLDIGRNIRLSADQTEAFSEVTGHVTMINNKIFVSAVYEIPGDVGLATGDVSYKGNVHVGGSVRSGFSITCDGDIIVDGEVEDALLDAGGQIIVKHGFHGKGNGILQSKSNVICKFIENGKVFAGGYVESGSVLNSEITAKGDVNICSKKGFIAGSIVRTIGNVSAVTIGSEIGSKTSIEAGVDADARDRLKALLKEAEEAEKRLSELGTSLSSYKNMLASSSKVDAKKILKFKQIAAESIRMQTLLNTHNEEIEHIRASLSEMSTARISVEHDIYPGVNLTIASYQRMLDKKFSHCYFVVTEGEIRMTSM